MFPLQAKVQICHLTQSASSQTFLPQQARTSFSKSSEGAAMQPLDSSTMLSSVCLRETPLSSRAHQCYIAYIIYNYCNAQSLSVLKDRASSRIVFPAQEATAPSRQSLVLFQARTSSSIFFLLLLIRGTHLIFLIVCTRNGKFFQCLWTVAGLPG